MASYSSTAKITLSINGRQAERMLESLRRDAAKLEKALAKATAMGDTAKMQKYQKALNSTNALIKQMQGSAQTTEQVLRRLDKASPKELNKALRDLQKQLNGIQRGTAAWDAHVAKIRAVKAELQKVNATMQTQQSLWARMNNALNRAQTFILGVVAALTGLTMAARRAVHAYAEMEESMANTRKYTRMSVGEVAELNEAFKKMDTRLARQELNALAQEGGRLGYNTLENVRQYVEAASVIKVALVDLGEGATQVIAKISNIFGIEQMYGVRDAMLKVGSTVNHLSQNCTASKPYLVEFAQRMAGIGSTAKMTVPEIMAFGATLDAHGQKVEMSATALQRTIMTLFKKPVEIAKKVGLDTKEFITTLNKSTTEGVMMFLDALNKLGDKQALNILAPMFQDLGLDGARVSSVLANLSQHIEFLRWELDEANQAFIEGKSASNEYAIFNNTVQAQIDKAKNRIHEMAVELGEKLFPVMKHIYTASSAFLRVLKVLVDFVAANSRVFGTLIALLGLYYTKILLAKVATYVLAMADKAVVAAQQLWALSTKAITALMQPFEIALAGVTNGIKYMKNGMEVNIAMQSRWKAAITGATGAFKALWATIKATPIGLLITAGTALISVFTSLGKKTETYADKVEKMVARSQDLDQEYTKEKKLLDEVYSSMKKAEEGTNEYNKAKNKMLRTWSGYLKGLYDERRGVLDLEAAYKRLSSAIERAAKERGIDKTIDAIENDFYEQFPQMLNGLRDKLTQWNFSLDDANEIVNTVSSCLSKGEKLPQEIYDKLIAQSNNTTIGYDIDDFFNSIPGLELFIKDDPHVTPIEVLNALITKYNTMVTSTDSLRKDRAALSPMGGFTNEGVELLYNKLDDFFNGKEAQEAAKDPLKATSRIFKLPKQFGTLSDDDIKSIAELMNITPEKYIEQFGREKMLSFTEALVWFDDVKSEYSYRTGKNPDDKGGVSADDFDYSDYTPYETDRDRRKREAEERRAAIKEKKEFKDALNADKQAWEDRDTANLRDFNAGLVSWKEYLEKKHLSEVQYFEDRKATYEKFELQEDEDYSELLKKKEEMEKAWIEQSAARKVADAQRRQQADETQLQMDYYTPGSAIYQKEEAMNQELHNIRIAYLKEMRSAYEKNTQEYQDYTLKIEQETANEELRIQKLMSKKLEEWKKQYSYLSAGERYAIEEELLYKAYSDSIIAYEEYLKYKADLDKQYRDKYLPDSAKPSTDTRNKEDMSMAKDLQILRSLYEQGLMTEEEFEQGKERIRRRYEKKREDAARKVGSEHTNQLLDIYDAWKAFFDKSGDDTEHWATKVARLAQAVFTVVGAGLETMSELSQASADLEVARAEKKYDREIELAEGNTYKTKKLEKEKEAQIAKIKNEASRKQYAMKITEAIANTAVNALKAYGSAQELPWPMSIIVGALAAGMATEQGVAQVAILKKQQQLAQTQGYAEGGFTRPGRRDEVAGVVHAGEWVASQSLVNNPKTRPLIEALDYAQRNNTIGSITSTDVSRSISAPMLLAAQPSTPTQVIVNNNTDQDMADVIKSLSTLHAPLSASISRLNERLDEPFVTVNTITGDHGINRAQEQYDQLMRNKSPKSKR